MDAVGARADHQRRRSRTGTGLCSGLAFGLVLLVGCAPQVEPVAVPRGPGTSALPTESVAAATGGLGIAPGTVTPTPTPTQTDVAGSGGGGGVGSASYSTVGMGMHVDQLDGAGWPSVPVGSYRIWNSDSTWGAVEPSPGQWNFRRLDARVAQARSRGASVLLVLSHPPTWAASRPDLQAFGGSPSPPKDLGAWRNYVSTVVARYAGQIEAYEIWNEPNLSQFFVGTPQQLGELTRVASEAIRATDAGAKVVSAGFSARTGGAEGYFRAYVGSGIASAVDVVGIHIYPYPGNGPESMIGLAQRFRSIANAAGLGGKPMWNTEIGYGRTPDHVVGDAAAMSLVLRTFLVMPGAGLARNYWYKWDDRAFVGLYLVGPDRRSPTAAGSSIAEARRWLAGGRLLGCRAASNVWTCTLVHAEGPTVTVAWSLAGEVSYTVPAGSTVAYAFGGGRSAVSETYRLGITPIMFAPSPLGSLE